MKKLISLVLALAMIMVVGLASANTITINQPTPADGTAGAETYSVYKVFDVTKTDSTFVNTNTGDNANIGAGTATGFSYTIPATSDLVADLWNTTTNAAQEGQTWVTLALSADGTKYNVTWAGANTEAAAKGFADWLLTKVDHLPSPTTLTSNGTTATGSSFDDGYYLITSSLGTNLVLATTNITINTKNEYVTDQKSTPKTDHNVGDLIPYTITVNLPASIDYTKTVTVHDTMDNVLSLISTAYNADTAPNGWKATVKNASATGDGDAFTAITLSTDKTNNHDSSGHTIGENQVGYDFTLDISGLEPATGSDPVAKVITITYFAELTSAAAADTGYVNKEFTQYSQYKTTPNDVTVKTFDFDLKKTFAGNPAKELRATFKVYPKVGDAKGTTAIQFINGGTVSGKDITYVKADSNDTGASDTIIAKTDSTGKNLITNVRGLEAGTYYLTEQTTAEGYNLLNSDVVITIDAEGNVTSDNLVSGAITVENLSGTVLPSTGGIGTTIFYIVGGLLLVGAAIVLVARRKAND